MKSGLVQLSVPLSRLVPSRRNPRKVKPSRAAHRRLVALIRSQGLLQPLVVRPIEGKPKRYEVVAGERRWKALREIHKDDGDPKVPCVLREVDAVTADAMSLGENFGREPMHPLDEADAFAKLATSDGKDAEARRSDQPESSRQRQIRQCGRVMSCSAGWCSRFGASRCAFLMSDGCSPHEVTDRRHE
jgi:ParB family chromosome partitioning protein